MIPVLMVSQLIHLAYAAAFIGTLIISFNVFATVSFSRKHLLLIAAVEIILITVLYSNNMIKYEADVTDFATRVGLSRNDQLVIDAYSKLTDICRNNIKEHSDLVSHLNAANLVIEKRKQDKMNEWLYKH